MIKKNANSACSQLHFPSSSLLSKVVRLNLPAGCFLDSHVSWLLAFEHCKILARGYSVGLGVGVQEEGYTQDSSLLWMASPAVTASFLWLSSHWTGMLWYQLLSGDLGSGFWDLHLQPFVSLLLFISAWLHYLWFGFQLFYHPCNYLPAWISL